MTEEEAKQKWCPFTIVMQQSGKIGTPTGNRTQMDNNDIGTPTASNCIGSQCMMWKWKYPGPNDEKCGDGWLPTHGNCGLTK